MERQVPSFQVAQKTAEISQVQFIDRVVRFFFVVQQIQYQRCRQQQKADHDVFMM